MSQEAVFRARNSRVSNMVVGRIFSRGSTRVFSKIFVGGQSGEICFFPLATTKTTLFFGSFQNPGWGLAPSSDAHGVEDVSTFDNLLNTPFEIRLLDKSTEHSVFLINIVP